MEASRGHPGGLCGHMCLMVTAIPGESCGPSTRSQATEPWHSEGAGGRARGSGLPLVLLWTGCMEQPLGWNRGRGLLGIGGRTRREPQVWTDDISHTEPQPHVCFPLLDQH